MEEDTNVYSLALKKWGEPLQIIMGIEEMAELTKELIKHIRGKGDSTHILEEMADVEIMLTQLKCIFGDITFIKDQKLGRLARMIKEEEVINDHSKAYQTHKPLDVGLNKTKQKLGLKR